MSEAEKTRGSPHVPPYSSPDPPPPGLPSTQQLAPPQQTLAVQTQPPPPTGPQYYTQLAYPAPQVVLAQPQQPIVATQQTITRPAELSTKLPKYAFVTSLVGTFIFTVLCWLPGLLCLVPATVMSIVALSKKEENKLKEAKQFSIISFVLVLIFAISYPILVTMVVLASVFGYICDYQYKKQSYRDQAYYSSYSYTYSSYGYSYSYSYRPSYCAR